MDQIRLFYRTPQLAHFLWRGSLFPEIWLGIPATRPLIVGDWKSLDNNTELCLCRGTPQSRRNCGLMRKWGALSCPVLYKPVGSQSLASWVFSFALYRLSFYSASVSSVACILDICVSPTSNWSIGVPTLHSVDNFSDQRQIPRRGSRSPRCARPHPSLQLPSSSVYQM